MNAIIPDVHHTKEDNALKAKLRRLCEQKSGGRLQVPQWLHDQWRTGDHTVMAREYQSCGFNKAHDAVILQSKHHPLIERTLSIPSSQLLRSKATSLLAGPIHQVQAEDCHQNGHTDFRHGDRLVHQGRHGKGPEMEFDPFMQFVGSDFI